jgi:hypothetical protein
MPLHDPLRGATLKSLAVVHALGSFPSTLSVNMVVYVDGLSSGIAPELLDGLAEPAALGSRQNHI